jgi:cell pole-organizing protein PopZ
MMPAAQPKPIESIATSEAAKANEPSMEEILASIRKIIADDQPSPAPQHAAPPEVEEDVAQEDAADDDVLDLASIVMTQTGAPMSGEVSPDDIDFVPEGTRAAPAPEPEPPRQPAPEPVAPVFTPPPAAEQPQEAQLLSSGTDASVAAAFGNLSHTILSANARTLDDLVAEMLRPMLKNWLDDNLPSLVERLVRAEIERVARGGR